MRYLYGDLTDFPRQDNFLELLQRFVDTSVDVVLLDRKIDFLLTSMKEDRVFVKNTLAEIDEFHKNIQKEITAVMNSHGEDEILYILAQGTADNLHSFVEEGKSKVSDKIEQRLEQAQQEIDDLSQQILLRLKSFFLAGQLPIANTSLHCEWKENNCVASSDIVDIIGIHCVYRLNASASDFFSSPKKFGDLIENKVSLPVGTKKAWLKKKPVAEKMRLDDASLISLSDSDDHFSYRLTKRGETTAGLRVDIPKANEKDCKVFRIDAEGQSEEVARDLIEADQQEILLSYWKNLIPHVRQLYRLPAEILMIHLNQKEIIGERLVVNLLEKLVAFLAPTIKEISNRSPSKKELCLKLLDEDGKREDIYIEKQKLLERIQEVPEDLFCLFAPLGLEPGPGSLE